MRVKDIKQLLTREFRSSKMVNSLGEIVEKLNRFAGEKTAESWDNVGLLIEPATPKYVYRRLRINQVIIHCYVVFIFRPIQRITLTNDLTEKVLHEAVEKKSDLIISYHPPIFAGLKSITQKYVGSFCFHEKKRRKLAQ